MPTKTKKFLIDQIADETKYKKSVVSKVVNSLFEIIVRELGKGNRIELRNFGVFELRLRKPRMAQNPKTMEPVMVEGKNVVKFKAGRLMKKEVETTATTLTAELPEVETPSRQKAKVEEPVGV
jgi:integration host factor subunit beta